MNVTAILCPTDFSEASAHAEAHAAALARSSGARLIPLHVEASVAETVPADAGVVSGVSPASGIVDFAEANGIDLIVMGTHGHSGIQHLILGSVTETVLRRARVPVLSVSPRARSVATPPFRRVLVGIDFSAASLAALRLASEFTAVDGQLELLHVVEESDEQALFVARPYDVHHHPGIYDARVQDHLERIVPASARQGVRTMARVVRGNAEEQILKAAAEGGVDLIAMGVGRGDDPAFGSTVNYVVRNAECPVLTARS